MGNTARKAETEQDRENQNSFSIGDLAREFDVTLRSIRFYEDQGLLHPTRVGTTRIFDRRDRGRLSLICRGKRLGFSLKTIKTFLDLYQTNEHPVKQMRFLLDKAQDRIKVLEQQRLDLEQTLTELRQIEADIGKQLASTPNAKSPAGGKGG
jgi:DNA-binding transcriptional MerR regulator